jgi:hypothetical protein
VFTEYFQRLFSSDGPVGIQECLSTISPRAIHEMNAGLTCPYTLEEVDFALRQMQPMKAPGPDGYSVCFFQQHWETVGPDIRQMALDFLNLGMFDPALNSTHIALIPKGSNATTVFEYRSICLCNIAYKIIAEVLANRLKVVLPTIISQQQSVFVPRRLISDNIIVACEALHTMNSQMWGEKGYEAIKVDISKAYDRVEWEFLEAIMRKLRFDELWTARVMACVSTMTYSVIVNGTLTGKIFPNRGIRQGDPLSLTFSFYVRKD